MNEAEKLMLDFWPQDQNPRDYKAPHAYRGTPLRKHRRGLSERGERKRFWRRFCNAKAADPQPIKFMHSKRRREAQAFLDAAKERLNR